MLLPKRALLLALLCVSTHDRRPVRSRLRDLIDRETAAAVRCLVGVAQPAFCAQARLQEAAPELRGTRRWSQRRAALPGSTSACAASHPSSAPTGSVISRDAGLAAGRRGAGARHPGRRRVSVRWNQLAVQCGLMHTRACRASALRSCSPAPAGCCNPRVQVEGEQALHLLRGAGAAPSALGREAPHDVHAAVACTAARLAPLSASPGLWHHRLCCRAPCAVRRRHPWQRALDRRTASVVCPPDHPPPPPPPPDNLHLQVATALSSSTGWWASRTRCTGDACCSRRGALATCVMCTATPATRQRQSRRHRRAPARPRAHPCSEGTHLMVPWFERPIIYDVRARPSLIQSQSGSRDLQMVRRQRAGRQAGAAGHPVPPPPLACAPVPQPSASSVCPQDPGSPQQLRARPDPCHCTPLRLQVNIGLRVLTRPNPDKLPTIYRQLGTGGPASAAATSCGAARVRTCPRQPCSCQTQHLPA
jgi:hypothetical protein